MDTPLGNREKYKTTYSSSKVQFIAVCMYVHHVSTPSPPLRKEDAIKAVNSFKPHKYKQCMGV